MSHIKSHFEHALDVLNRFIADETNFQRIEKAGELMAVAIRSGGKIISCGNGGSMADAMHFAEEMTGRFREDRKGLPAIAISDPTHISCVANDYGYEHVFSRFVETVGMNGDVLLAISTSGNSANVVNAAEQARMKGMTVVALTGKTGGKLAELADVEVRAPQSEYADRVQEIHIKIIHSLIDYLERNV